MFSLPVPPVQNKHISALCNCLKTNDRTPNLSSLRLPLRLFPRTPFLKSRPFFLTFHGHSRHFSSIFSTAPPKSLRFPPLKGNLSPLSLSSTNRGSPSAQRRHQPLRACPRLRPCFFQLAPNFSSAPSPQLAPASLRASPPLQPASLPQSVPAFPSELLSARSRLSSARALPSALLSARACFALSSCFSFSSRLPRSQLVLCPQLAPFLQHCLQHTHPSLSTACTALAPFPGSARARPSAQALPPTVAPPLAPRAAARDRRPGRAAVRRSLPPSECSARRKCCSCGASRAARCAWCGSTTSGPTCRAAARCAGPAVRAVSGLRGRAGRRGLLGEGGAGAACSALGQSRVRSFG